MPRSGTASQRQWGHLCRPLSPRRAPAPRKSVQPAVDTRDARSAPLIPPRGSAQGRRLTAALRACRVCRHPRAALCEPAFLSTAPCKIYAVFICQSILQGEKCLSRVYEPACSSAACPSSDLAKRMVAHEAAKTAKATVLVLGLTHNAKNNDDSNGQVLTPHPFHTGCTPELQ
jgi:hypothetical protein